MEESTTAKATKKPLDVINIGEMKGFKNIKYPVYSKDETILDMKVYLSVLLNESIKDVAVYAVLENNSVKNLGDTELISSITNYKSVHCVIFES